MRIAAAALLLAAFGCTRDASADPSPPSLARLEWAPFGNPSKFGHGGDLPWKSCFSPDGTLVFIDSRSRSRMYSHPDGQRVFDSELKTGQRIKHAAFSADSRRLIGVSSERFFVLDSVGAGWETTLTLDLGFEVGTTVVHCPRCLDVDPAGATALVVGRKTVLVDLAQGQTREIAANVESIGGCFLSTERIALADVASRRTIVVSRQGEVIDCVDGLIRVISSDRTLIAIEISPDGAAAGPAWIEFRRELRGPPLSRFQWATLDEADAWRPSPWPQVSVSASGGVAAVNSGGTVKIIDPAAGTILQEIDPYRALGMKPGAYLVGPSLSDDGGTLLVAGVGLPCLRFVRAAR